MNKLLNQLLILAIGLPVNDETQSDRLQIIKYFLDKEVDVNLGNDINIDELEIIKGYTPLAIACLAPNPDLELILLLLEHGANPNKGATLPLFIAIIDNKTELVKLLLEHGANPNVIKKEYDSTTTSSYHTPLTYAFGSYGGGDRNIKIVKLLLEYGADFNYKYMDGLTILEFELKNNHNQEILDLLNYYKAK